jgi:uncharacterized membrane protein
MRKRVVRQAIKGILIGIGLWLLIILLSPANTFLNRGKTIAEVERAHVYMTLNEDGSLDVSEHFSYRFVRPYRGVFREIPPDSIGSRYSEFQIEADGLSVRHLVERGTDTYADIRVWFVPLDSDPVSPQPGEDTVTVTFSYTVYGAVEAGADVLQLFRKIWGEDTVSWVPELSAVVRFPDSFDVSDLFTHPPAEVLRNGNTFTMELKNHPPQTFAEFRAVIDSSALDFMDSSNIRMSSFTRADIEKAEQTISRNALMGKWVLPIVLGLSVIFLPILIFFFFGRQHHVDYSAEYERETPTGDSPDIINFIVRNVTSKLDNDGIGAVIMNLYRLDYIDFEEGDKKGQASAIIIKEKDPEALSISEKEFFYLLKQQSTDNSFNFEYVKKQVIRDSRKASTYASAYNLYKLKVKTEASKTQMIENTGTRLSRILSFSLMVASFLLFVLFYSRPEVSHLALHSSIVFGGVWTIALAISLQKRDVFGRWTRHGREFYLKWENFRKFITDYSLLNERPPDSVSLWEEYLVYATALGVADQVRKNFKRIVPEDMWEGRESHRYLYTTTSVSAAVSFAALSSAASSSDSSSSSGGAGGGGGGGGTGGF